ncbi:phytanoyl-CoA dioxygenase family protein [Undibacterium sp.]|uniref:phytanoyl-CoA dioxygenase family protein n=1 Tax=Undibacterium sp. TaxID=1914977 RepID=UPI0037529414
MSNSEFKTQGFFVTPPLLSEIELAQLSEQLAAITSNSAAPKAGDRQLLSHAWCSQLAQVIQQHALLCDVLPASYRAVQCSLFEKSVDNNWLVALHQDLSIPVAEKVDHPALNAWSNKDGCWFVQAPVEVLEQLVAVRLHVDVCTEFDGALKLIPGSHQYGKLDTTQANTLRAASAERLCAVERGAALVMRPLVLHASSKASGHSRRRVLHFVFGPQDLPYGLQWHYAV